MAYGTPNTMHHDDHHPTGWRRWLLSTNHKDIGTLYIIFSIFAGLIGGLISVLMRAELMDPGMQIIGTNYQQWNVWITAHGLIMVFFVVMPALGIHRNTVPGKLTEAWVRIDKPGTFYGQCMQICGVNHGFMPIVVHALPKADYDKWLALAKQQTAAGQPLPDVSAISSIAAPANPPVSIPKN